MKQWKFPAGEIGVQVDTTKTPNHQYHVNLNFRSSDDIISMLMQVDAIRRRNKSNLC